ncbi:MAG: DEAD/DEAH box helicase [Bacteroidota bacterium]
MEINPFEAFNLNPQLYNAIKEAGYTEPTEIQKLAIPQILAGHDILGIAQTGTGKTAAFLLPILMKIKYAQGMHMRALILAPTRELVMQIDKELAQLAQFTDIRHVALFGGLGPKTQIEIINKGVDIIVATPGRFLDLYLKGEITVKELKILVLDEADKMMDMGFMPQIRKILEVIPSKKRQNLLFSATFPPRVENLSNEFLEFPLKIEAAPQASTAKSIHQKLYELPNFKTKINLLELLLRGTDETFNRVIVFTRTKEFADNIFKFLERKVVGDWDIKVIHSNKGQNTRINAMEAFKEGNIRVLVTTDVASRGIDIPKVSHVINFDVPLIYEDYVHRIGRTGRAQEIGEAITFMTSAEEYHVKKIEEIIKQEIPRHVLPVDLRIEQTPPEEKKAMLLEIDNQKKKADPTFKGAFHEKKKETQIKIAKAAELKAKKEKNSGSKQSQGLKSNSGARTNNAPHKFAKKRSAKK